MDKNVLKRFAIESRKELMDKIRNKVNSFYVDENFKSEQKGDIYILSNENHSLSLTNEEFKKRELLIKRINDLSREQVVEEAAYTWFNRIIAIRYMEINDMLPLTKDNQSLGIRILSSRDNIPDPEILKFTNLMNPELDIDFKKEKYAEMKDDNDKFKYVLLLVCKKIGRVIPQVFDGITDYIDILVPDNLLNDTGFITKIINEVPEGNYNQVEIIGWLYQYYNQTEKDRVISAKKAYKKNEIPYATQLFTPDWIVKYMVENSLGKYWIEHNGDMVLYPSNNLYPSDTLYSSSSIVNNWKYFIKDNIEKQEEKINPTEITFIDPCCGSGHILVYAFEVFYQIYLSEGYNKNNIPELILRNNLYGLDIDDRAAQLSILSIILKAREYDKNIFNKKVVENINIMSIQESNSISEKIIDNISDEKEQENARNLVDNFKDAKEIGSLILVDKREYSRLKNIIENDDTIFGLELKDKLIPLINIAQILQKKYSIVATNPPYMSNSVLPLKLKNYLANNYDEFKYDVFSAFIKRNMLLNINGGKSAFMTPNVCMFIQSFYDLRKFILNNKKIDSFIQLSKGSFFKEASVDICSFVINNESSDDKGIFIRLEKYKGDMQNQERAYLNVINDKSDGKYIVSKNLFKKIEGIPIAFWISEDTATIFNEKKLEDYVNIGQGLKPGDTQRFVKGWYEIEKNKINKKWFLFANGGEYRKWYGNFYDVVNWERDGDEVKNFKDQNGKLRSRLQNMKYYFKSGLTWSALTSKALSVRYVPDGYIYGGAGYIINSPDKNLQKFCLGFLNSKVQNSLIKILSETLNFEVGNLKRLPIKKDEESMRKINELVDVCIELSKNDWNSFEISNDFKYHPLLKCEGCESYIKEIFGNWEKIAKKNFELLKRQEESINKIFIDLYGLGNELDETVEDKDITIRLADKERDIKSLISYAVGCMFGRYSLDKDGLIYAGGDFDNVYQKYKKADGGWAGSSLSNYKYLNDNGNEIELSFEVDNDNIIPITDEAYFSDDIVERFKTFIKTVYGDNTFNENMDFIAEALGKRGTETSEETIRRYFVNDFFNDHVKMYQKRPIYWLLDSGKKNGFKALVYMHRYNENLIPKARLDYLHRVQTTYEKLLSDVNYKLTTDLSMTDKKEAKNRQADLNAKLTEIKEYDEKIAHIANQRISIDLDDGVKANYDKFKDILAKIK